MPGSIVRVAVAAGDEVVAGQPLMWLEAMKMQHQIYAPVTGTVTELNVTETTTGRGGRRACRRHRGEHMSFTETPEQLALREAVAQLGAAYGYEYMVGKARSGGDMAELYAEAGKLGYLGINLPTEYGGGGGGMYELAIVAGCGLEEFGDLRHRITTTARRESGDDWILNGAKTYISGVDVASNVLVVARTEDSTTGALKPVLFVVPTDAAGLEYTKIEMDIISADRQFSVFLDDVRLPSDALVGAEDAAIDQLFAGLNPERIMASAFAVGMARYALGVVTEYAKERVVWRDKPIGSHQGVAHPLAQAHIEVQLAKLMMQKARLYDQGDHMGAGEAANMAKYAAGEAGTRAVDQAVQTLGGNGLASEYGLGAHSSQRPSCRVSPR
jgi:alkylation response protein AidB-like acyl-CoA dehydrogenase